jgi:hypothetical protein
MKECDIGKVEILLDLFEVEKGQRDEAWIERFHANVADASFRCETPQIFSGPDGFPYFSLLSPEPLKSFEPFCICNLTELATERGFGIAINRSDDGADWVFSSGDLLCLRLTGNLCAAQVPRTTGKIAVQETETALAGSPAESCLPAYTRAVIREFMRKSLGVESPAVFLLHRSADRQPQLVFSIFPEQFQSEAQYLDRLGRIGWFLPRHYAVTGISQASALCSNFMPL